MSVESRHASLVKAFGGAWRQVALVHGRMSADEKDQAMSAFKSGQTRLLVATTVIEVGVDVPDATIMVIEHAERFGLGTAASAARPRRPRQRRLKLHPCSITARWATRQARGCRCCAKPKTGSASPRKISSCAVKGKSWAHVNRACPVFRLANLAAHAICWKSHARRPQCS
jgi:hypothetical protein